MRASKWRRKWVVPKSDGDGTYTVAQDGAGNWACSCPRWKFGREECKHIQTVQLQLSAAVMVAARAVPMVPPIGGRLIDLSEDAA